MQSESSRKLGVQTHGVRPLPGILFTHIERAWLLRKNLTHDSHFLFLKKMNGTTNRQTNRQTDRQTDRWNRIKRLRPAGTSLRSCSNRSQPHCAAAKLVSLRACDKQSFPRVTDFPHVGHRHMSLCACDAGCIAGCWCWCGTVCAHR